MRNLRIVLLAFAALAWAGLAAAQAEPTLQQIYATAQSGQVDKARQMTQEVLRNHPNSAKAHFVLAELEANQGNATLAREELAAAERLAPGLPFARPEAVQALRRLDSAPALRSSRTDGVPAVAAAAETPRTSSFPWGIVLLAGAFIACAAWFMRSRTAARSAPGAAVPARFGAAASGAGWGAQQPGAGAQPGDGPAPAPPVQPGMGGNIMGGLATGLAVGAGALAAQEIGRRMMGDQHSQQGLASPAGDARAGGAASDSQLARDAGLGSVGSSGGTGALADDFGINDTASWDDAGGSVGGDDGGWDNS
ncbi:MAG: hypothetical protein H7322_05125 [Ramlibacter sp.]|nr:hypothetical protein [Ramlibacter sp.]